MHDRASIPILSFQHTSFKITHFIGCNCSPLARMIGIKLKEKSSRNEAMSYFESNQFFEDINSSFIHDFLGAFDYNLVFFLWMHNLWNKHVGVLAPVLDQYVVNMMRFFYKKKWYPSGIENESRLVGKIVITTQLDSNHQMGVGANLFIKVLPHLITINIVAKA